MPRTGSDATPFFRLAQVVLRGLFQSFQGLEIEGLEHIPSSGPCLVVANHSSWLDPPALGCAIRHRQLHYMAKHELFERPLLGPVIRALGAFPVDRGQADRRSLRTALQLLEQGRIVCLFPEGTRQDGEHMGEWLVGAAMLALHAQVPIIPVALYNTRQLLEDRHLPRRGPIRILVGPALDIAGLQGSGKTRMLEIQRRGREAVEELRLQLAYTR